jgi:hypothetical protein
LEGAPSPPPPDSIVDEARSGLREIEEFRRTAREQLGALRPEQWGWRPAKERWSVGECVAHVNQTNRVYIPAIEASIGKGRAKGMTSPGPYRHGFLGEIMIREIEPPARRRFRAPRAFVPPAGETGAATLEELERLMDRLSSAWLLANGLDLGKVMVTSPANRFLRLSLGQAFRLVAAHARRHLWQAQRIANDPRFPRS